MRVNRCAEFELAPSTVSRHLSILKQAGLVDARKNGRWIFYFLPEQPDESVRYREPGAGMRGRRLRIAAGNGRSGRAVPLHRQLLPESNGGRLGALPQRRGNRAMVRRHVNSSIRQGARSLSGGAGFRVRRVLVAGELALATVLIAGAGFLLASFLRLQTVSLGFNPKDVFDCAHQPARSKVYRRSGA
jgi:DNA-binding transcriptional ArsR family regulator